ncbi:hypothetical protein [Pseudomonas sp. CCOS 191]|nr:hypothetical protein [Pseudomonas sp. CCOS 191]CRI58016.1 hypothetical protein CCOS191_3480 [Pseudomonas sp. CCOS 191]
MARPALGKSLDGAIAYLMRTRSRTVASVRVSLSPLDEATIV